MTNTYLLPICQGKDCWIDKCFATEPKEAKEKFIADFIEQLDLDENILDWETLSKILLDRNIVIGDVYDIEEF